MVMMILSILLAMTVYTSLLALSVITDNTIIKKDILSDLHVLSSFNKAVITLRGNDIIGQGVDGLNFAFISKYGGAYSFTRHYDPSDPVQYDIMTRLKIIYDGYLIVAGKGYPFRKLAGDIIPFMRKLGSDADYFRPYSNYILISQFIDGKLITHYESASLDTITYPLVYTEKIGCLHNPTSLKPFKHNMFYSDIADERILTCSMEAKARGMNKYGILDGECIPITDKEYDNTKNHILKGSECLDGEGGRYYMSIYDIKRYDINQDLEGVLAFETANFSGRRLLLTEGEHINPFGGVENSLNAVRSIIMNDKYIMYGVTDNGKLISFRGPARINIDYYFIIINVIRIRDSSVIFYGDQNIYAFDIGRRQLPPYMYIKINRVELGKDVKRVILYSGFNFSRVIENRAFSGRVEYPRVVRSIEIK